MEDFRDRIARLVGAQAASWQWRSAAWQPAAAVEGGNERYSVLLDDGRRVFVKAATSPHLAAALRREAQVYAHLAGDFMPQLIAYEDDARRPLLVIEDLSDADWCVRWDGDRLRAVLAMLSQLAASAPPPDTPPVRDMISHFESWSTVERDPAPFLSTAIRSSDWLARNIVSLTTAAATAPIDGDDFLHLDVRSDNLCFRDGRAILVDWNWSCTGRAEFDIACWLPSLALEGGPQPWEVLPAAGGYAALLAGIWASVVGLPAPPTAPTVRAMQRRQLEVALAWSEYELGLR